MSSVSSRPDVGVLGAGIMGCCLALELARRGHRVDLIERAPAPMTGASLHNEGKLHLGFVYANDPQQETHRLMARGSLSFARILEQLTGAGVSSLATSQPFHYFVPVGSQLDLARIDEHFHAVDETLREIGRSTGDRYLGQNPDRWFERNADVDHAARFAPALTQGSFCTRERSVSPVAVAGILTRAVTGHPGIRFVGDTEVVAARRLSGGEVDIEWRRGGQDSSSRYACAANCLWEDKLRVDATAGIPDGGPWLLRYKATIGLVVDSPAPTNIPSATGILGSYGDVVDFGDGTYYVSWYPRCKLAQSTDGEGRKLHESVHTSGLTRRVRKMLSGFPSLAKSVSSLAHRGFARDCIRDMTAYVPSLDGLLARARHVAVGGGVIVARGATDIDDPRSFLHRRSAVGPVAYGSYVTVDTGKYCTAPMFALEAAAMIADVLR